MTGFTFKLNELLRYEYFPTFRIMKKNLILDSKLKHFILKIILTMSEADKVGVLNYEI